MCIQENIKKKKMKYQNSQVRSVNQKYPLESHQKQLLKLKYCEEKLEKNVFKQNHNS